MNAQVPTPLFPDFGAPTADSVEVPPGFVERALASHAGYLVGGLVGTAGGYAIAAVTDSNDEWRGLYSIPLGGVVGGTLGGALLLDRVDDRLTLEESLVAGAGSALFAFGVASALGTGSPAVSLLGTSIILPPSHEIVTAGLVELFEG